MDLEAKMLMLQLKKRHFNILGGTQQVLKYCCFMITLMRKKKLIPSQGDYLCGIWKFCMSAWIFSVSSTVFPHPKDVHVKLIGVFKLSQSVWEWVCVMCPGILGCPVQGGSCLVPCAVGRGSSDSGICWLENHYLICL